MSTGHMLSSVKPRGSLTCCYVTLYFMQDKSLRPWLFHEPTPLCKLTAYLLQHALVAAW